MHDVDELERRGVPSVMVASAPFVAAAATQSRALGFDIARVFVDHPIQDRTDEEMTALADEAGDALIASLTGVN